MEYMRIESATINKRENLDEYTLSITAALSPSEAFSLYFKGIAGLIEGSSKQE
jgi:hypothetical protein